MIVGVGRLWIFNFPLLLLTALGSIEVAAFGDTDAETGDEPAGADSSSSTFVFAFDLDLDLFLDTLRRERTDHGRFLMGSKGLAWGEEQELRDGGGG